MKTSAPLRTALLFAALLLPPISGCKPPPLTDNGVVGVFGELGVADGAFSYPRAISIDGKNRVYVVDKSARVQRFSPKGDFERCWHMPERQAGKPVGIFASRDGRVFVPDTHYSRVIVYTSDGEEIARFGELGTGDGQLLLPTDVDIDSRGFVYVAEYNGNDRITRWTPDYKFDSVVVAGEIGGAHMQRPSAIDIDNNDTLWITDSCNHRILHTDLQGKLLAAWGQMGREPGELRYPYDIEVLENGTVLVCEFGNDRVQWFDQAGHSQGTWGRQGRGLGELWAPWGAAVGADDNLYVVDSLNARVQIVRR